MRDQLIRYVDLLFAGAADTDEIKQEILQNTLDRYDDLVSQGKAPAAAYSLAISGIGDISEILSNSAPAGETAPFREEAAKVPEKRERETPVWKKILRIIAVFFYIISLVPMLALSAIGMETMGLCAMVAIAAVATVLLLIAGDSGKREDKKEVPEEITPRQELRKAVQKIVSTVGLVAYVVISFGTHAWHITWLVFPIVAAVQGIVTACMDLKEEREV